jgi:RimJ/RimL family protein N-acetyltransferase
MPAVTRLEGRRLLLRDLTPADLPAVHAYGSDPEAVRYQAWGPNTPEDSRAFLRAVMDAAAAEPRANYTLAIELVDGGDIIGTVSLLLHDAVHGQGELGYFLNRAAWGNGYATEAAHLVLEFAFETLGLHRVYATVDPRNAASVRVLQKLGMTQEGHLRETMLLRDGWRDSLLFSLLDREWNERHDRAPM